MSWCVTAHPVPAELVVLWKLQKKVQFIAENPQKVPSKFLFLLPSMT